MANEFISTNPLRFTGNEKTCLRKGEFLKSGQYLFSPDGCWRLGLGCFGGKGNIILFRIDPDNHNLFICPWAANFSTAAKECFAIMQEDGNFCVYEGSDPQHQGELLWAADTSKTYRVGVRAVIQHDGNFCVYNHDSSTYKPDGIAWQCGFNSGLVDHYEFSKMNYDYNHMIELDPEVETAFTQTLKNKSSLEQKTEVKFSITKTEKHSWQTKTTAKLGIKATTSVNVPLVAKIGIEISGEFSKESAEGKETATEKTISYTVPVTVPPMKAMTVDACITKRTIILPYTSEGNFSLKEGTYSYCELAGDFKIMAGSELNVYYQEKDLTTLEESEPIKDSADMLIDGENRKVTLVREADSPAFGEPVLLYSTLLPTV